eukprot:Sspe_Gene.61167::Locus_33876_Transcript_2_3_Confidence_0.400_Length_3011::g.61167::m.61167
MAGAFSESPLRRELLVGVALSGSAFLALSMLCKEYSRAIPTERKSPHLKLGSKDSQCASVGSTVSSRDTKKEQIDDLNKQISFLKLTKEQAVRERDALKERLQELTASAVPRKNSKRECRSRMSWRQGALIGQGRFGTVHIGMNNDTGAMMAVKHIKFNHNDVLVKNKIIALEEEIEHMKSLRHPCIVRYLSCEREGDGVSIFTEYVAGGSLASLLQQFGAFKADITKYYVREITLGLQYLHSQGVTHGDVKTANILLTVDGQCRLTDYGCMKIITSLQPQRNGLQPSPSWVAPEVLQRKDLDTSTDIWSLGCTTLEMATGRPPFDHLRLTPLQLSSLLSSDRPLELPSTLPAAMAEFVASCLQRTPSLRPTATALLSHSWLKSAASPLFPNMKNLDPLPSPKPSSTVKTILGRRLASLLDRINVHSVARSYFWRWHRYTFKRRSVPMLCVSPDPSVVSTSRRPSFPNNVSIATIDTDANYLDQNWSSSRVNTRSSTSLRRTPRTSLRELEAMPSPTTEGWFTPSRSILYSDEISHESFHQSCEMVSFVARKAEELEASFEIPAQTIPMHKTLSEILSTDP